MLDKVRFSKLPPINNIELWVEEDSHIDQIIKLRKEEYQQEVQPVYEHMQNTRYQNMLLRAQILDKDYQHKAEIKELAKRDSTIFFDLLLRTYDPRATPSNIPFILYPFQREYIRALEQLVEKWEDGRIEKSRDMGFSWLTAWFILHRFLFHQESSLLGSYKLNYTDQYWDMSSLFEKLRFMIERLPKWLIPDDLIQTFCTISSKKLGAEITWDAWKKFGTGGRKTIVFMDEFQYWEFDKVALRKTKDVAKTRIFWGTPEGLDNVYGKVMTNHPDYRHMHINKITLKRNQHPTKTPKRYEIQKLTRTELDLAQEVDISYEASTVGAVYPLFNRMANITKFEYNPNRPTYTGWDFGRDMNAVIIAQVNPANNDLYILDCYQVQDYHVKQFGSIIINKALPEFIYSAEDRKTMARMQNYRYTYHYWDPYNIASKQTNASKSINDHLHELGINMNWKRGSTVRSRISQVQLMLPRMHFNEPQVMDVISAVRNSRYSNPATREPTTTNLEPIHNEYSHLRTALEYLIDNIQFTTPNVSSVPHMNIKF